MKIIEFRHEDKEVICSLLTEANKALEEAMYKIKEASSESDTRMWEARGDYRRSDYRGGDMRYYPEDRRYRDDFRYRY